MLEITLDTGSAQTRVATSIISTRNEYGCGASIVVVANYFDGALFDWSAYFGAYAHMTETADIEHVARHGDKLPESMAVALCPDLDEERYRV